MTRHRLDHRGIPPMLCGWIAVSDCQVPRYWATIWSDALGAGLADATRAANLAAVDKFYRSAEDQLGYDKVDLIIASMDFEALEALLGGFLTRLRNESKSTSVDRDVVWRPVLKFIDDVMSHLSPTADLRIADVSARLLRLKRLYRELTPSKPRPPRATRALPASVLENLYEIFNPESISNPFRGENQRRRNYLIFILLLHLGLRRGELLLIPVDTIKEDFDYLSNRTIRWINVTDARGNTNTDPRSSRPSIKTNASHRQLPVSEAIAELVDAYAANFRDTPHQPFLFTSQKEGPLAKQTLADIFNVASRKLSDRSVKLLATLNKTSVTPHDLRHTAAVIRLRKYHTASGDLDASIEKLRVFFGWGRQSDAPKHYARAYFEPSLADVWDDSFDSFVEALRAIGGNIS